MHPKADGFAWAVVGDPIEHSLSPTLFLWLLRFLKIPARYTKEQIYSTDLPAFVHRFRFGALDACNITLPHKEKIMPLLDDVSAQALQVGAVNTVARRGEKLFGTNTDVQGIVQALLPLQGKFKNKSALILGAGGAARAAILACYELGISSVVIVNRTQERAQKLATHFTSLFATAHKERAAPFSNIPFILQALSLQAPELKKHMQNAALILQCSSVGLQSSKNILGERLSPTDCSFQKEQVVFEMVYSPLQTSFLKEAALAGAICVDGLQMLVHQALASFSFWTAQPLPLQAASLLHAHLKLELQMKKPNINPPHSDEKFTASSEKKSQLQQEILIRRKKINALDHQLIALLAERAQAAKAIGEVKTQLQEPVVRPERELELRKMHEDWAAEHGVPALLVRQVFDEILRASRALQQELKKS